MHLRTIRCFTLVVILASSLAAVPTVGPAAESPPAPARTVFERNKQSLVKVTGVAHVRLSAPGRPDVNVQEQEAKVRADGTIIDADGLVVVALSAVDPSRLLDGREVNTPGGPIRFDAAATIEEMEIVLGDGTEIPATMVFKDVDLDLAFVRPKADAPEAKGVVFDPVDLADAGTAQVADHVVTVARLDEPFANEPAIATGQVAAVVERPRPFYVAANASRGCPMFTLDGKIVGIGIVLVSKAPGQAPAIVPAAEVRKLVEQIRARGGAAQPAAAAN